MKRIFFALSLLVLSTALWAVPAERMRLKVRLTDGTEVFVTTRGDEHLSWLETDAGDIIEAVAGRPGVYQRSQQSLQQIAAVAATRRAAARRIGSRDSAPLPCEGSPKVPVVLVSFQDSVFHVGNTDEEVRQYYDLFCNGTRDGKRYTGHNSYGSICDYFLAQSDTLFQPEFVVIGPVKLDHPVSYYGRNSGSSKDVNYKQFTKEAITQATALYDGNWSDFDNRKKGNGNVDLVFFIFAGCGENTFQSNTNLIWPKENVLGETSQLDDGTTLRFGATACCCENYASSFDNNGNPHKFTPDGIGVMCHELSHALGLPDFYDTVGTSFGMDVWSLMDYGCYMKNGHAPVAYTAYERDFMGWRSLVELKEPGVYTLDPIATPEGVGMKIVNPENKDEYYIVEARLGINWDRNLSQYGKGLQVTHVDYQSSAWNGNRVNSNANHQRMTIIAANNDYHGSYFSGSERLNAWKGNLYPYIVSDENGIVVCNDSLTANSTPAAKVFSTSGLMPHTLSRIALSEDELQVSFLFDGEHYDAIHDLSAEAASEFSDGYWHDLSGRRVAAPWLPGIYVRGGRKVVVTK